MYGKSNIETYITICKIDSQWEFAIWLRKLKQGLCINLEGWDREGDGTPLQYFGHLMRRVDSLEKTHAGRDWGAGGEWDNRG